MQGSKLLRGVATLLIGACVSAPAFAVMSVPYGWYLEGNLGESNLTKKSYPGSSSSSGLGKSVIMGYKFMPYVAAEAGYSVYADTDVKNSAGTKAAVDNHDAYFLAIKGIAPVYDSGFEAFAKIGVTRIKSDTKVKNAAAATALGIGSSNHTHTGVYLGFGAQYFVTPELALVAQWARSDGDNNTGTADLISGGVSYNFG